MPAAPLRPIALPGTGASTGSTNSSLPTIGVEEEFLLLDPATGLPVPVAGPVLSRAKLVGTAGEAALQTEVLRSQVETATPVCSGLGEVLSSLNGSRRALAVAAAHHHVDLAAVGAAPNCHLEQPVTQSTRYLAMRRQAPALLDEQLVNGMHVHVEVPSREVGVDVMNRLRPYLPVLLAFSANSPVWRGRDTGFSSWRAVHTQRWAVEGPPPRFVDVADHDRQVAALVRTGAILDVGMVYWQVRLSERNPTVEVRVADVAPDVPGAAAFAGLVRGLVVEAFADGRAGRPCPDPPAALLRAASWQAARSGLDGELPVPSSLADGTVRMEPAASVLRELAARCADHVGADGDLLVDLVGSVLKRGNGAQRQREALARGGLPALVRLVRQASTALGPQE